MALLRGHKPSHCLLHPFSYHVFLSFRGEDTRKNFTDHLYTALVNAGFHTFRDDPELERGENIKEKLEKAIRQSQSSVIVFSKDYTSSRWCLDELVMILERKRTSDHVVFPVFYDVDPSDVRKQAETLAKVPKYQEESSERLNGWRAALREVADLAGMVLQNEADGHEAKFIQKIIRVMQEKLGRAPMTDVVEVLQKKLLFVKPFLDDADGKQLNNPIVKEWLYELKEAVFDTEDLLQEIKTEVLRQKMESESDCSTSEVQGLISTPPSHIFDLASIYPRVEEVLSRVDSIMEQKREVLGMEASAGFGVPQTIPSTSLVVDFGVCGRDEEKETLKKLLLTDDKSGNKVNVIPIVGMGGIGKTTLAQFLYNDDKVKQHFDLQAWACVSEKFDVIRISQQIYESFTSEPCFIMNLNLLQSKLKESLMGKRILLVFDDMWSTNYNEWDVLRRPFQFGAHGSKIIVTTRNQEVAGKVCTLEAHRLMPMSEEDGWSLFEKHAFKNAGVGAHSHLEEIGRQIVRKCNGLPLAIKSLGGLLCSKLTEGEWESILNSEIWELPQEESDILPSLWLSYKHLPAHLRRCFAYCSIFPKNYMFQKSDLILMWKAVDLLQPKKNKMAEEIGIDYIHDLYSRSFFQFSSTGEGLTMHDLINDLANFVSTEFCYRWEGSDSSNGLSKTRHFSYKLDDHDEANGLHMFEALQQAKCLRTFLPLKSSRSQYLKPLAKGLFELLPKLQCLRVLVLSGHKIEELPQSLNNLKQLRCLDLSSTPIRKLPDSICNLYNLQSLSLESCSALTELPANLGGLINLSQLYNLATRLMKMPPNMGNLKNLRTLDAFVVDKHTAGENLLELKKLQNLRGTLHISGLGDVVHGSTLEAHIMRDKKLLRTLVLNWGGRRGNRFEDEIEVLEKLQPHPNLERLTIEDYGGRMFPGWPGYYSSSPPRKALVYLELVDCVNCISLPPLGQLPCLRELNISGLHGVVSIGSEFYYGDNTSRANKPFRSLQSLRFYDMRGWQEWFHVGGEEDEGGMFPNLVKLNVSDCPNLSGRFEGWMFPNLVQLDVSDCPNLSGRLALDSFPVLKEVGLNRTKLSLATRSGDSELSLNRLDLFLCTNIVAFPGGGLHAPNLTKMLIKECGQLSSLPEQMETLLPSLVSLSLMYCPELECFAQGGFPSKLDSLIIMDCKKLNAKNMQKMNNVLRRLTYLENLTLDFYCDEECGKLDCFSEGFLPSTLDYLGIHRLKCEAIDGAIWFGNLNSLQTLEINNCSALQCLPDCLLPMSIIRLFIHGCPLLERRYQSETGEDRCKISHISAIWID